MKQKRISLFFVVALLLFGLGYIFTNSIQLSICLSNETVVEASCINFYERLGDPMFYGGGALSLVFLILLFLPSAFGTWKKFAVWFVPLAALLFAFYPDPGSGDFLSPYPEQVFKWVSVLYVLVGLGIIGWAKIKK